MTSYMIFADPTGRTVMRDKLREFFQTFYERTERNEYNYENWNYQMYADRGLLSWNIRF